MRYRVTLDPEPGPDGVPEFLLEAANIPRRTWKRRLRDIPDEFDHKGLLRSYIGTLHECEPDGMGLIIHGPTGTGKTTIACRILVHAMRRGPIRAYYVRAEEIPSIAIKNPVIESGEKVWDLLCSEAQIIVIDDLGNESKTNWNDVVYRRVLNARYEKQFVTIVVTNTTPDKLFERVSRLGNIQRDAYTSLSVAGPRWRD